MVSSSCNVKIHQQSPIPAREPAEFEFNATEEHTWACEMKACKKAKCNKNGLPNFGPDAVNRTLEKKQGRM